MSCPPIAPLLVTLLLPIIIPHASDAMALNAHLRRKRDYFQFPLDLTTLKERVGDRLTEFRKRSCAEGASGECQNLRDALEFLGLSPDSLESPVRPAAPQTAGARKKGCVLGFGNHCQTELMDDALASLGRLGSGSSPGKRRRRSKRNGGSSPTLPLHPAFLALEEERGMLEE